MHTADSDIFLRLKDGKFEVRKTLTRGEWGVTQDDAGRIYRNTNESSVHVDYVPTPYFLRNPALVRTRGSYEAVRDEDNAVNTVWPVRPNPGTNRAYQFGIDRAGRHAREVHGGLRAAHLPRRPAAGRGLRQHVRRRAGGQPGEPHHHRRRRPDAAGAKAYERGEFLASTDERFRPVYLSNAPDGTLYIVDMYRGVIQQRADITEYLRDHIVSRKLEAPNGLGRIYRVMHETTKRDTASPPRSCPAPQLVDRLSHPNGWWRDAAQRLLVERDDSRWSRGLTRAGRQRRRTGGRGCTRCGRWTASTRSSRPGRRGAGRSVARRACRRRSASRNGGWGSRTIRCRRRFSSGSTIRNGRSGISSRHRWGAAGRRARAGRGDAARAARATIRSRWMRRSAACAAAKRRCSSKLLQDAAPDAAARGGGRR